MPSGLAAITLVDMALLKSGDEVLIPDNAYGPGKELARQELSHWGIAHRFYDPADPAALAAMIGPATQLLWLEAAGFDHDGVPRPARAGARGAGQGRAHARWTTPGAPAWPSMPSTWARAWAWTSARMR